MPRRRKARILCVTTGTSSPRILSEKKIYTQNEVKYIKKNKVTERKGFQF